MAAHLRPRLSATQCVVCRDALGLSPTVCPGCRALYHGECLDALYGKCATFGCGAQVATAGAAPLRDGPPLDGVGVLLLVLLGPSVAALCAILSVLGSSNDRLLVWWILPLVLPYAAWLGLRVLVDATHTTPPTRPAAPLPPRATAPPPTGGPCLLCPRLVQPGTTTCSDHAALLGDRMGPRVQVRPRPGQLFGPGLVDGGERPWRS